MAYMRQRGFGDYEQTGDWSWEFYPPPYDFLAPSDSVAVPAPVLYTPASSGPGLGCACGGKCGDCGGLGLFDSGLDLSQWGVGEWVAAAGIGYLGITLLGGLMGATRKVRRTVRKRSATAARRRELQRELEDLG
jgi:hypothetical protein